VAGRGAVRALQVEPAGGHAELHHGSERRMGEDPSSIETEMTAQCRHACLRQASLSNQQEQP
jgi:hypothetical protein